MSIDFDTNPGGLFRVLGKLGKVLVDANIYSLTTLPANIAAVVTQLNASGGAGGQPPIEALLPNAQTQGQNSAVQIGSTLQTVAQQLVEKVVQSDNPQSSNTDLSIALKEVIRQLIVGVQTVKACTVAATPATVAGNTGNGVVGAGTKRWDGLVQENIFAEVATVRCIADSYSLGATAGNESFQFLGQAAEPNVFAWNWPAGSGAASSFNAIDGSKDNSSGNLLKNSSFEIFTVANTPDNWVIAVGAAGTEVLKGTATGFDTNCVKFVGSATNTAIQQTFNVSAAGTAGRLLPNTVYALNIWLKVDVVPAAGVLAIELVDGSGTVVVDDQGNNVQFTKTLSGVTVSFVGYKGFFTTPKLLPTTTKIRLRLSTALSVGSVLFLDRLGMGLATLAYQGGPYIGAFSGSTPFLLNDSFTVTTTNDRGGAAVNANFQTLFHRFFNMAGLNLLLPSAGSPTIPDSRIG